MLFDTRGMDFTPVDFTPRQIELQSLTGNESFDGFGFWFFAGERLMDPPGRRFMSQGGGDPKWVAMRMGPWTTGALMRVGDNRDHKHLGYMAIRGIALHLQCPPLRSTTTPPV
jgi:hypothetical protein